MQPYSLSAAVEGWCWKVVAILDRCFGTTESAPKADTGGEQEGKEGDEALCRLKPKQEGRSLDEIKKEAGIGIGIDESGKQMTAVQQKGLW